MNNLHLVAVPLHIAMMKMAIVTETRMVLSVAIQIVKQRRRLVDGFMPLMERKLNVLMD